MALTWIWSTSTSGEQDTPLQEVYNYNPEPLFYQVLLPSQRTYDTGDNTGGGFHPIDEPLRSDGAGSKLATTIDKEMDREDGS